MSIAERRVGVDKNKQSCFFLPPLKENQCRRRLRATSPFNLSLSLPLLSVQAHSPTPHRRDRSRAYDARGWRCLAVKVFCVWKVGDFSIDENDSLFFLMPSKLMLSLLLLLLPRRLMNPYQLHQVLELVSLRVEVVDQKGLELFCERV